MQNIDRLNIELDEWYEHKLFEILQIAEGAKKRGEPAVVPVVVTEGEIQAFALEENYLECVSEAVEHAHEQATEHEHVIFIYDAFVTVQGNRTDAILLNAYHKEKGEWMEFAQRYSPKRFLKAYKRIGNLLFVGFKHVSSV